MKIKVLSRERLDTKTGTLTLQDARLPCDKRIAYTEVGGSWTLNLRLDSSVGRIAYKIGHPGFAGCPFAMRQAHGICYGLRGSGR